VAEEVEGVEDKVEEAKDLQRRVVESKNFQGARLHLIKRIQKNN
jgi:hypothetical protein